METYRKKQIQEKTLVMISRGLVIPVKILTVNSSKIALFSAYLVNIVQTLNFPPACENLQKSLVNSVNNLTEWRKKKACKALEGKEKYILFIIFSIKLYITSTKIDQKKTEYYLLQSSEQTCMKSFMAFFPKYQRLFQMAPEPKIRINQICLEFPKRSQQ